jgi:hypothetical protein
MTTPLRSKPQKLAGVSLLPFTSVPLFYQPPHLVCPAYKWHLGLWFPTSLFRPSFKPMSSSSLLSCPRGPQFPQCQPPSHVPWIPGAQETPKNCRLPAACLDTFLLPLSTAASLSEPLVPAPTTFPKQVLLVWSKTVLFTALVTQHSCALS